MRVLVSLDGKQDDAISRIAAYLCEGGRDSAVLYSVIDPSQARETYAAQGGGPVGARHHHRRAAGRPHGAASDGGGA